MTIVFNNLKRILKVKSNLIIMFIMPLIFITIFMMQTYGGATTTVGIVDKDNTKFSSMIIDNLKEKNNVIYIKESDIKSKLVSSSIDYGMVIDKGFTKNIINNKDANIQGYSIKESNMSLPTKFYIDSYINSAKNIGAASRGDEKAFYAGLNNYSKGNLEVSYKQLANTKSKGTSTLIGLGFLIMSMLFLSNMTAQIILDDKKNKTFYRIFASPISARNYMLQNVLSFFMILMIQLAVIFAIMKLGFNAYFGPSIIPMFGLFAIFSLVCVSLGVAISSISKDTRQAGALNTFITVPMCMLGGCFWPRDFMPDVLLKISNFIPTTWVLKGAEKLINGDGIGSIFTDVMVLLLFTLIFILLGSWKKADITK